jgi:hypothetical protein
VIPSAPKASESTANCPTLGILPPRALRNVATLLIFTLKRVIIRCKGTKKNAHMQDMSTFLQKKDIIILLGIQNNDLEF